MTVIPFRGRYVDPYAPDPHNPFGVAPLGAELADIEDGFWTSTAELSLICAIAHARKVGRWGLLGAVLANLLSWVPPYVVLPDADGNTSSITTGGSLNFFMHLVAESGDGKGRVQAVADELVPPNTRRYGSESLDVDLLTNTTGEGLVKHVVSVKSTKDDGDDKAHDAMIQVTSAVMVQVDEVSNYVAELCRTGSKAAGIFTSLWSGKLSGTGTSTRDNRAILPPHAARLVMLVLAQPEMCGDLFTDELISGGTPQRPVWLPADDYSPCPVTTPPPGVSIVPPRNMSQYLPSGGPNSPFGGKGLPINALPPELRFPAPAATPAECVWIARPQAADVDMARMSMERDSSKLSPAQKARLTPSQREARKGDRIQRHTVLTRLKVMVALAVLHGRPLAPSNHDWELSGVVMRVNLGMLAYLHAEGEASRLAKATRVGRNRADERDAERETLEQKDDRRKKEIVDHIWNQLAATGQQRITALYHGSDAKKKRIAAALHEEVEKENPSIVADENGWYYAVYNGSRITHEHVVFNRPAHSVDDDDDNDD